MKRLLEHYAAKAIEHSLGIACMVFLFGAVFFVREQRFDIVACCLLCFNIFGGSFVQVRNYLKSVKQVRDYEPVKGFPIVSGNDVEQDMEIFDDGYITGIAHYLDKRWHNRLKKIRPVDLDTEKDSFLIDELNDINEIPKLRNIGVFTFDGSLIIFKAHNP
jgi:hypothetical protein